MNDSTYSDSGAYCERGSGDAPGRGVKPGRGAGVVLDADGYFTRSAAVVVWGCVFVVVGVFVSSVVWGWPLGSRDSETAGTGGAGVVMSSDGLDQAHSAGVQVGDGQLGDRQMSGRFEVGKDGKLLRPSDAPIPWQPQLPAAAREETPEGMEAFTRYVLDLVPYMWMSGNTKVLDEVSDRDCQWCREMIRLTQERTDKGGWVEDAKFEITAVSDAIQIPGHEHSWSITVTYQRAAMTTYNGIEIRQQGIEQDSITVQARFEKGHWRLIAAGK